MAGTFREEQLRREVEALTGEVVGPIGISEEGAALTLWLIHNGTAHRTELADMGIRSRVDAYCRIFEPTPQGLADVERFIATA